MDRRSRLPVSIHGEQLVFKISIPHLDVSWELELRHDGTSYRCEPQTVEPSGRRQRDEVLNP